MSNNQSYSEQLLDMCDNYDQHGGMWHSFEFWERTRNEIPNMNEEECKLKIEEIVKEAEESLNEWRNYQ